MKNHLWSWTTPIAAAALLLAVSGCGSVSQTVQAASTTAAPAKPIAPISSTVPVVPTTPADPASPVAAQPAAALSMTATNLASAVKGMPYTLALQATGGSPAYVWSLATGSLPEGLSLSSTGVLSGTPTGAGSSVVAIAVADSGDPSQIQARRFTMQVVATPLTVAPVSLPSAQTGVPYAGNLLASGGTPGYTWSVTSGSLPAGLSLAATTGVLSGTPSSPGTSAFTLQVHDNTNPALTQTVNTSINVADAAKANTGSATWYVRKDGGTRWSSNVPQGQCDGKGDAPYPGSGVNQHCAFNDIRLLWQDGSYATDGASFPGWGWIGKGGDTYMIRGSIAAGTQPYRIGWSVPDSAEDPSLASGAERGIHGDPGGSGAPTPPAGTSLAHTRILGENWQSCRAQGAKTPIIGGWGVGSAFNFATSYVDFQCFDISDQSDCVVNCSGQDFATEGIGLSNTADHLTLTDVKLHGLEVFGMFGPSGDGDKFTYIEWSGNGGGGWSADANDGKTGTGSLLVQNYVIKWNGCAEEYPIVDTLPYKNCRDQNDGGYGDGFGTATVVSKPGWQAHFDQGEVEYNTQDGLDALHLIGDGSSMTITRTLAYGNMGQQIKIGGAAGVAENNLIVGNCNALRSQIPGTPAGFNANLSDFCRAGNATMIGTTGHGSTLRLRDNTIMGAGALLVSYQCDNTAGPCDSTALVDVEDNIFVGNPDPIRGAPGANFIIVGDDTYTTPAACNAAPDGHHAWTTDGFTGCDNNVFGNPGSVNAHNIYYGVKDPCNANDATNVICGSPGLDTETIPDYGYPDVHPLASGSAAFRAGVPFPELPTDELGNIRSLLTPTIGAYEK